MNRIQLKFDNYKKALSRLVEALEEPTTNSLYIDGVIQRFEFTYELSWKLLKEILEYQGVVEAKSPRSVFKEAYSVGLITNSEEWIAIMIDRNRTSYSYDEKLAREIYNHVETIHVKSFLKLEETLKVEVEKMM